MLQAPCACVSASSRTEASSLIGCGSFASSSPTRPRRIAAIRCDLVGLGARAAGVLDLLLALPHAGQVGRQLAPRVAQVDLEARACRWRGRACPAPIAAACWRPCRRPSIARPSISTGGKAGRQRAAGHDVLRPDGALRVVEILRIAGADVYRADRQAHLLPLMQVEIDQALRASRAAARCRRSRSPRLPGGCRTAAACGA